MTESQETRERYARDLGGHVDFGKMVYEPLNPNEKFDEKTYVGKFDDFMDLQEYVSGLRSDKSSERLDAIRDLGKLLMGDRDHFERLENSESDARAVSDFAYESTVENTARYVQRNLEDFFKIYEDDDLRQLILTLPIYKLDNKGQNIGDHNDFVDLLNELRSLEEIKKNPDKMVAYVDAKIKKSMPEWFQKSFRGYSISRPDHVARYFERYSRDAEVKLEKMMRMKDRGIDTKKLEYIIRNSLAQAWEEHGKESHEGDKKDIWERAIRPVYIGIAQSIFKKRKAKLKMEKDPAREARKARRRKKLGLPA